MLTVSVDEERRLRIPQRPSDIILVIEYACAMSA
jgi:hypothetical protein